MITERVLNKEVLGRKVKVGVALNNHFQGECTKYYEGVLSSIGTIGKGSFIVLDNNVLLSIKYIQTIEIIG